MKKLVIAMALLAGCSDGDGQPDGNQAAVPAGAAETTDLTRLTGLYEGGAAATPNQMCVVERRRERRFGLVVWGGNLHSCSGTGIATRDGDTLRLAMAGDEACTIDAAIDGATVTLPDAIPEGCAYYCGARATLAGATFTQKGTTDEDAVKAKDLVGEPLCG